MEKIEVGEYGRTNLGEIIKFAWLEESEGKKYEDKVILIKNNRVVNEFYYFKENEYIVKHSKNIIDLIENNDVLKIKTKENEILSLGFNENTVDLNYKEIIEEIKNKEYQLLEILTHEKYEKECYRIGE